MDATWEAMRHVMKKDRPLTTLENVYRWLKLVGGSATAVVAIFIAISTIIGTGIIQIYLSNFLIPITPLPDLSQQSLQIFILIFIALLACAVGSLIMPFLNRYSAAPETVDSLPNLFGMRYSPDTRRLVRLSEHGTFFGFLKEYLPYYFPFVILNLIVMPVYVYFEAPIPTIMPWSMASSFVISTIVLYIFRLKGRRLKIWTYIGLIVDLFWSNYITIVGMLLLEIVISKIWQNGVSDLTGSKEKVALEMIVAGLVVIFFHAFIARVRPPSPRHAVAGLALIALVVLYVYPGPIAIVAGALREAQLGGGTRISYTVIGTDATTPQHGCLVLATTGHLAIGELDDNGCSLPSRFAFSASEVKKRPVHVFSRSEVNISEVPGG
jgi:hypothetical protein